MAHVTMQLLGRLKVEHRPKVLDQLNNNFLLLDSQQRLILVKQHADES